MIECIQAGAADYVLHPLRPDVIKTLFLVIYIIIYKYIY
jgi:hypothetical protein